MTESVEMTVPGRWLRPALDFARQFAGSDYHRPTLGKVQFCFTVDGGLWLAATDSFALGWAWVGDPHADPGDVHEEVTAKAVVDPRLLGALIDGAEHVDLRVEDGKLWVATDAHALSFTDDDAFPNWHALIKKEWASEQPTLGVPHFDPARLRDVVAAFDQADVECRRLPVKLDAPVDPKAPYLLSCPLAGRWALLMPVRVQ